MLDQTPSTLADALAMLEQIDGLTDERRRDLRSAITRCAGFLGKAPHDLPANAPTLRAALAEIHPRRVGIKPKSLSNVKTDLARALQLTGQLPPDDPDVAPTRAWEAVIGACAQKHQRHVIARFIRYCCNRGIEPEAVDDTVVTAYRDFLDQRVLGRDPARTCKKMAQFWNGLNKRSNLGLAELTYEKGGRYRARPLTDYPQSLQDEIAAYLESLRVVDVFAKHGRKKALKPMSLRNTEAHFRQYLDGLVSSGQDIAAITCLKDVITADKMRLAFNTINTRMGDTDTPPPTLHNIAASLKAFAKYRLDLPNAELLEIANVASAALYNPEGMSEKNRERLTQFDSWQSVLDLMNLPRTLMQQADEMPRGRDAALKAMHAAAIAILLAAPMRIKNVSGIRLDVHLLAQRQGKKTAYIIRVPDSEVKNRSPIDMRMNIEMSGLLRHYMDHYRPLLTKKLGDALFPQAGNGEPRKPGNLGQSISSCIKRETGLDVHPHFFRHLAAYLFLQQHPGEYETVRRLLGHKKLATTMKYYAEMSSQAAHDRYDHSVLSRHGGWS